MRYIYVSGPYSQPDQALNVRAALDAATALMRHGMVPFVPHLTHFWHLVHPADYEDWLAHDLAWVERCDAVLRLPGVSPGADREVAHAQDCRLPVFFDIETLLDTVVLIDNTEVVAP